jgi:ribonuclease D
LIPVEIVSQPAQLEAAARAISGARAIALDTESNSRHRYPEQLCLIQIATIGQAYLVDTIALKDIDPLRGILLAGSTMKVIHGADYDIRCLDRYCGCRVRNLYDTSIAARFAGITKFGLADLLEGLLGVDIPKSKRLQLADWGRRPIPADAVDYAIADVSHLLTLQETLAQRLEAMGRTGWVAEECARVEEVRYAEPNLETAFLSVKGAGDLDGSGLAILRSLFRFREGEARRQGRPPFFIVPDAVLLALAASPNTPLSQVPGLGQTALERFGRGLQQAVHEGQAALPFRRSPAPRPERPSPAQIERLSRLKAWRAPLSAALALDPSLLWPTVSLERLARAPETLDDELASGNVRQWQRDRFAASLRAFLQSLA